ncbi:MAG: TIGR00266 family protein [Candidatus Aenigmarchaeota archaeon]|nr:TIGR00266 family protein [Candidatus Aenigmarchaeota archaeon]
MDYKIRGTVLQIVDIELAENESIYTEKGGMSWMSPNIKMETNTKGGLLKGFGRMVSGESLFMTTYNCTSGTGSISFSSEFPGKIVPMKLKDGESIICQRDSFMVAENGVSLNIELRKKLGAGLFGGEGFIMQKVTGPGTAFLEIAGEITEYTLEKGQQLKIDPGHIAFFEPTVNYDITRVEGVKNILFGGEGLFLATLEGPGKVWLQSMPIANLARKISKYIYPKK